MPGFVVTVVFDVDAGKAPLGADVLAQACGMGHRFSYCDGRMLTLVAQVTAADRAGAFEAVLSRAEMVWAGLGHGPLAAPTTVRIQGEVGTESVPAGLPGAPGAAGPQPPNPAARSVAQWRAQAVAAATDAYLHRRRRGLKWWTGDQPPDPPDDGGLAGVREPRRPAPGSGGMAAALEPPRPLIL
jgi:hypothetical protein